MKILVDMDGVIADFEGKFLEDWRKTHPDKHYVPVEERTTFYLTDQYPSKIRNLVEAIYQSPGFYRSLAPIAGGLDSLKELRNLGHEVFICTSPLSNYENCVLEKYQWVERHLGGEWVQRVILTKDKTIISGDILIDDRPSVRGVETPRWEHVLYDQPYNRNESSKRRLTWENWRTVLSSGTPANLRPDAPKRDKITGRITSLSLLPTALPARAPANSHKTFISLLFLALDSGKLRW